MLSIALVLQLMMNLGSVSSPIYQLSIETQKCTYSITLNAYPLTKPNESDRISIPLNLYLIGPKNQLKIQHKGKACQWVLTIFKQVRGKMIKFTQAQGRGTSYQVLSFDTEVETFRQWTQSKPFHQRVQLKSFAVRLVTLLRAHKYEEVIKLSSEKISDYAQSFGVPAEQIKASMRSTIRPLSKMRPLSVDDIVLEPLLGGRLWRLRGNGDSSALLSARSDDAQYQLEVIVAKDKGSLVIVR